MAEEKKKKYNKKIIFGILLILAPFAVGGGLNPVNPEGLLNILLLIGGGILCYKGWKDLKK